MRILVTSDTHGDSARLRRAVLAQPQAEAVIHLGDGAEEAEQVRRAFLKKAFYQVKGNCDWGSSLPDEAELDLEGVKIFYTHGHLYGVKSGDGAVLAEAGKRGAQVLLFGHTHQARADYQDGLYILNPGRLSGYEPSYGTIDITPQGIVLNIVKTS